MLDDAIAAIDQAMDAAHLLAAIGQSWSEQSPLILRASLRWHRDDASTPPGRRHSPALPGQVYEAVISRMLAEHCLDEQGVWGVAGWPTEDVLHGYRGRQIQSAHRSVVRLVEAIDADASTDVIEHALTEEPLLTYRFLRYANSAAPGLRASVDSLRHALMLLGLTAFLRWLLEQLPHAGSDLNLQPVRTPMVLRNSGPYAPLLEIANALEYPHMQAVPALCAAHQLDLGEVKRALLRVLSHARPHPPRGRLLD